MEALSAERLDFEAFDQRVGQLADELAAIGRAPQVVLDPAAESILASKGAARWQLPIGSAAEVGLAFQHVLSQRLTPALPAARAVVDRRLHHGRPSCLVDRGLPHPDTFAALLDGCWNDRGWGAIPMQLEIAPGAEVPDRRGHAAVSIGRREQRRPRARDQSSSLIERPEVGIWAVADGVGGHSHGKIASRMVCDAVADVIPGAGFADVIASVRLGLNRVNDYLVRQAERVPEPIRQHGGSCCSREAAAAPCCGRRQPGVPVPRRRLTQLARSQRGRIRRGRRSRFDRHHARAVGGDATLDLDELQDRVHAGDGFLLARTA